MIIYTAYCGWDEGGHYATLREAVQAAREAIENNEVDIVEIERNETVDLTKANLIDILNSNGGQWSRSHEIVKTIRRKGT